MRRVVKGYREYLGDYFAGNSNTSQVNKNGVVPG